MQYLKLCINPKLIAVLPSPTQCETAPQSDTHIIYNLYRIYEYISDF